MALSGKELSQVIARRKETEKTLAARREVDPNDYAELRRLAPKKEWYRDCQMFHGGSCNGRRGHALKVRDEELSKV